MLTFNYMTKGRGSNWLKKNLVGKHVIYICRGEERIWKIEEEGIEFYQIYNAETKHTILNIPKKEVKYCTDCYLKKYLTKSILL